ncbi:hypothetical protein [Mesorhizobium sp.]|uniref:hypothetical protein n=1 Tax=Mesorhizobium sp. TaxID=1871066 RepID=UPI0025BA0971|nr:hypothetical protein [Mesorhizobium sp.]
MFALPQAIIHFQPLERLAQQCSSAFDPKQQFLQFPSAVRIIEDREGPGVAEFRNEFQCSGEILMKVWPERLVPLPHPGFRSTTILRRTVAVAAPTRRIVSAGFDRPGVDDAFGGGAIAFVATASYALSMVLVRLYKGQQVKFGQFTADGRQQILQMNSQIFANVTR